MIDSINKGPTILHSYSETPACLKTR